MDSFKQKIDDKSLMHVKQKSIKAASDLNYSSDVIERIENAETEGEVYRILIDARRGIKE